MLRYLEKNNIRKLLPFFKLKRQREEIISWNLVRALTVEERPSRKGAGLEMGRDRQSLPQSRKSEEIS